MSSLEIDSLIRSRRRTIALVITAEAKLIVRAPLKTPLAYIESVVERKRDWIGRKQEELRKAYSVRKKTFLEGEAFSFPGDTYRLAVADNMPSAIELKDTLTIQTSVARGSGNYHCMVQGSGVTGIQGAMRFFYPKNRVAAASSQAHERFDTMGFLQSTWHCSNQLETGHDAAGDNRLPDRARTGPPETSKPFCSVLENG